MTNKNNRKISMLIGHHFGKRKPQWNFFIKSYENFKYSPSARLVKLVFLSLFIQMILFTPVIYWIYQNYAIIEKRLPAHLNLAENIQFEKKWIVFIMLGMSLVQCFWNYFIWKNFAHSENHNIDQNINSAKSVSHDEADYQRHAS